VLLWSTHDPSHPIKNLEGHTDTVVDVVVVDVRNQLFSLSVDQQVKLWDLRSMLPAQTISLDPAGLASGRYPGRLLVVGTALYAGMMELSKWDPEMEGGLAGEALVPVAVPVGRKRGGGVDLMTATSSAVPAEDRQSVDSHLASGFAHADAPLVDARYIPGLKQLISIDRRGKLKVKLRNVSLELRHVSLELRNVS
jgi:hypothetical protein